MMRDKKDTAMPITAPHASPDHVPNMAAMTGKLGLSTVPAAWPTGVPHLALAINTCQHCEAFDVCNDWLARAPEAITTAPAFCPNAAEFTRVKRAKQRD
jgi:hypothetical protein